MNHQGNINAESDSTDAGDRPVCVDLDGTLLRSDLLYESLLALLARNPLYIFLIPLWLLRGKAALKRELASRVTLSAESLPYDERVIRFLQNTEQRPRVLCTASDILLAQPIADHLGLFENVVSSDGQRNLAGKHKAEALIDLYGARGFDYMGNSRIDLDVWRHAGRAIVVNAGGNLARSAKRYTTVSHHWPVYGGGPKTWVRALRIYQWAKNLLVLVPLLAAHRFLDPVAIADAAIAFLSFGLCASGVYLLNDLLDLASDRQHPRKRKRPFAAGALPLKHGLMVFPTLTLASLVLAWWIRPEFALVLVGYCAMTLTYSFKLKRIVMIDVVTLAALYTVRIIGGAAAIGSGLSFWLLSFSMFIFLSLALLKRYTELSSTHSSGKRNIAGRGYMVEDLPLIQSLGSAAGYMAVLVLALYIDSPDSLELYHHPKVLWLICPALLYWISRAWIVAHRGHMHDDPIVFAARDRISQVVALITMIIVISATLAW